MIFEEWITAVEALLNTGSIQSTATLISLFLTIVLFLIVEIAAGGKGWAINGLAITLFTTLIFTLMEWYPIWTGAVIALSLSIVMAWYVSSLNKGGK